MQFWITFYDNKDKEVLVRVMKPSHVSAIVHDEQARIETTEDDYKSDIDKWRKENQ